MGKPILRISDVDPNSVVASCVYSTRPIKILNNLKAQGIKLYGTYLDLARYAPNRLQQIKMLADTQQNYLTHSEDFIWLRGRLCDQESKEILDRLLEFRINANLSAMSIFKFSPESQYFEPFCPLNAGEVFVDGGGFDGYTSLEFISRCPKYAAIHFFEPSAQYLEIAKIKLGTFERIHYHQLGLYDQNTSLRFDASAGPSSCISEDGAETINVVALDNAVTEPVSFIKFDLEGAEPFALRGCTRHIRQEHPKLAIAVYHKPQHFYEIPRIILDVYSGYEIYLRHYTEGCNETIMFFVPE
ncbi:hypothetical protein TI04_07390 [Achromatium sp. WMS2]|nr:hypothetical protein TI04_07390 [Achromatium sp. WMS2]